jgi:hypothetical protein
VIDAGKVAWSALVVLWSVLGMIHCQAHAQQPAPVPEQEWTPHAQLWAARACFAEAAFNLDDCRELLWVVTRRSAEGGWVAMLRTYCAGMRPRARQLSARQAAIRRYPWGDVPGASSAFNRRWGSLRTFVQEWGRGEHPSRCNATHWGGRMDAPQGDMVPVRCIGTANTFYRVAQR